MAPRVNLEGVNLKVFIPHNFQEIWSPGFPRVLAQKLGINHISIATWGPDGHPLKYMVGYQLDDFQQTFTWATKKTLVV